MLLVAHDVNPMLHDLDRVVYVAGGRIVSGTPEEVITSETLSALYGVPIEVLRTSDGRLVVVGTPEAPAHHSRPPRPLMFAYPFMVNALEAGTIVALIASVAGWFMVLRRQSFAGHTLAVMSFPGASARRARRHPARGRLLRLLRRRGARDRRRLAGPRRPRPRRRSRPSIGTVQVAGLALGFLFLSLYGGILESLETMLFGSFLGITHDQVLALLGVAAATLLFFAVAGRPLLYASVDPLAARARGVPVRLLEPAFLLVLGLAVAATAQITGVLLVFALLVAPAAAAQRAHPAGPARARADGRDRARRHLARARARLLHRLPGRLLRHVARLRRLGRGLRSGGACADARVRPQRPARRLRDRDRLGRCRLLRRAPRPGVRRRRAQPRRVHGRPRRRPRRDRPPGRALRGHDRGRAALRRPRRAASAPTTSRSA